ncbi:MAG: hypothetical protein ACK51Z_05245, partial [Pseudomonadota bacterium]
RPRGSGETVRMGAAATIRHDLTAAVGPSWLASVWSSGFRGRLNFLCAGRPTLVEADLAYWLSTVRRFCPWGSYVYAVLP